MFEVTIFTTLFIMVIGSGISGLILGIPQYLLCKPKSKWLGLVLPVISFILSVLYPTSVYMIHGSKIASRQYLFLVFLVMNLCTLILMSIYWYTKGNRESQIAIED